MTWVELSAFKLSAISSQLSAWTLDGEADGLERGLNERRVNVPLSDYSVEAGVLGTGRGVLRNS